MQGIPIFIEKPISNNDVKSNELLKVCKKNSIKVLIGNNLIFHPAILKIKQLLSTNVIGHTICSRAMFGTYLPGWHPWEDYKLSYASKKEMGGGVTLTSIHELNYITYLFGDVKKIMAMEIDKNVLGIEVEEGVEILIKHTNNIVSNIHLNFFQKPNHRYCEIIGTEGTIIWDFWKPEIQVKKANTTEIINIGINAQDLLNISYQEQMKHFVQIVIGKVESKVDLIKGLKDYKLTKDPFLIYLPPYTLFRLVRSLVYKYI